MKVIGFTRDSDNLMCIVLTQPYVNCLRLATKEEIANANSYTQYVYGNHH